MRKISPTTGFTIIELMIATTVFSVILLICAAALIQIGRSYQKGVIANQTQEVARSVMSNISETIQFDGGAVNVLPGTNNGSKAVCLGNKRFTYLPNLKLVDGTPVAGQTTNHALVTDVVNDCSNTTIQNLAGGSVNGKELLAPNMQVLDLSVCAPGKCPANPASSGLYQVSITVAYGDVDLINTADNSCVASRLGGSFCAVSRLSTTVQRRIVK
jgi:prepilin-type N-terminal cleavage/methylation domain-containing protein